MKVSAINNSAMQNKTNSVSSKAHLKVLCSAESAIGDMPRCTARCSPAPVPAAVLPVSL